jgi:hypothetical protein
MLVVAHHNISLYRGQRLSHRIVIALRASRPIRHNLLINDNFQKGSNANDWSIKYITRGIAETMAP